MPAAAYFGFVYFSIVAAAIIITTLLLMLMQERGGDVLSQTALNLLVIIYLGWFLSHAILLRNIGDSEYMRLVGEYDQGLRDSGFFYVIFVVTCTFLNDTGAYYIGKWKGRRKLSPEISPGKTVEGTLGGIITAIVTAGIVNLVFKSPLPYFFAFVFAFIVSLAAIFGDLFESMIKRTAGVKDSGAILPGHGGILDRFDSLILVFPVSFYLILLYYLLKGAA